jgi:hypothetical protein
MDPQQKYTHSHKINTVPPTSQVAASGRGWRAATGACGRLARPLAVDAHGCPVPLPSPSCGGGAWPRQGRPLWRRPPGGGGARPPQRAPWRRRLPGGGGTRPSRPTPWRQPCQAAMSSCRYKILMNSIDRCIHISYGDDWGRVSRFGGVERVGAVAGVEQ